ncbi:hypothetical protein [Flavobacterium gelatinilyticum]|uniref:hypothetical protein n=1 Tax=Flavobacterium gelatinilyticum TaxID=3003260 RepID=UPI002480366D|nr:hypothetical protein [Flavobacterium gelatinilyticum]
MKNAMLNSISWNSYLVAVITLLVLWYLYTGLRYYSSEIKQILSGRKKIGFPSLGKKTKNDFLPSSDQEDGNPANLNEAFQESFATLDEVKELSERLTGAVSESAELGRAKQEFNNYIRLILSEYPYVKISSLRSNVNNLLAYETKKHPELLLTSTEADELWEENN